MIDFNTFTKLPKNVGDLDKLIVAKGLKKDAQSPIKSKIWSYWWQLPIANEGGGRKGTKSEK